MAIIPIPDTDPFSGSGYVVNTLEGRMRFAPNTHNFFQEILTFPCARPLVVFAITFVPAFIELALTAAIFDLEDALRAEAKALAGEPRGRRRRPGRHARFGRVPTERIERQKWTQSALRHVLRVTQPLEYFGLGVLLYFAADRFFYRWGSLIEAVAPCEADPGTLQAVWTDAGWFQNSAGGATPGCVIAQNSGGFDANCFGTNLPPGRYTVVMSAKLTPEPTTGGCFNTGIRLLVQGSGFDANAESGLQKVCAGQSVDAVVVSRFFISGFFGGSVAWETYGDTVPVGVRAVEAMAIVSRQSLV